MSGARVVLRAAVLALVGGAPAASAQPVRAPVVANPDPAVQAAVAAESATIQQLLGTAVDRSAPTAERVKALNALGGVYFDHFLANAERLAQDQNPEVAKASVLLLGGQIAMLHASHAPGHAGHAPGAPASYDAHIVMESIRLLRAAMDHPDSGVRNEAAAILTSRGDLQALAKVQSRIEAGQMTVPEGVKYMSLAPLDVAAPYIAPHLAAADPAARRAAVIPLSYHPGYTAAVRSLVVAPNGDETVVRAALPGLSVTDKDYATYGSAIVANKALSRETREVALESAVRFALKTNAGDAAARALATTLDATAEELQSDRGRAAVRELKARHQME